MRTAAQRCRRLIPLYSVNYWQSGPCIEEFDAYWRQHLQNAEARFLLPITIQECTVPDMHAPLLASRLYELDRDGAHTAILNVLKGIAPHVAAATAYAEAEPPFPGKASTAPVVTEWPDTVPALRWPLADHDNARAAFATLVTRSSPFRLLAVRGESETGKTHLTRQFFNNAQRRVPGCRCGRFDFKGTGDLQESLAEFVDHLQVPFPAINQSLPAQLGAVLRSLTQRAQPTLLIFDAYEYAGDADRWVRESLLTSLRRHSWLRVVLAGKSVPEFYFSDWEEEARVIQLQPPEPKHWHAWGVENNRGLPLDFAHQAHAACRGKASTLASLFGPVNA